MDFFSIGLSISCLVFLCGAAWRVRGWLVRAIPGPGRAAPSGFLGALADIVLLRRTLRTGRTRWAGHMLLAGGFVPLLVLHAMDGVVTRPLFAGYEPTLEPWQSLRNLFGLLALAGLGLLLLNRLLHLRALSRMQDWLLAGMLGALLISGFALEGVKIASPGEFARMIEDYFPEADGEELLALKTYWAAENGVRFDSIPSGQGGLLERGRELHEDRCASCHAPTSTAFASRPLSRILPASGAGIFWHLHVGLAFLLLALTPWGKFFHPVSASANLLLRGGRTVSDAESGGPPRGLALDACTRCGQCSLHCSVAPSHRVLGNPDILPMDKLADLRRHADGRLAGAGLGALVEGSHICTECLRCTEVCSAGIDLQELWMASKKALADSGRAGADGEIRKRSAGEWARELASKAPGRLGSSGSGLADRAESFWGCVQCTTCTGVCPVVAVSEDPARDLDLTPQQIMNLLRMGLKAQTLGARMVWSCTTCYKCQEHCPQGVPVADILYELRGLGAEILRDKRGRS